VNCPGRRVLEFWYTTGVQILLLRQPSYIRFSKALCGEGAKNYNSYSMLDTVGTNRRSRWLGIEGRGGSLGQLTESILERAQFRATAKPPLWSMPYVTLLGPDRNVDTPSNKPDCKRALGSTLAYPLTR
jgi:hypothetical protein